MQVLTPRATDLGGLDVRRLLPQRPRRMVGAWCFLDLFGPARFTGGRPVATMALVPMKFQID